MFVIQYTHAFEAAHRLLNHSGKCRHLHGHSYKVDLILESRLLHPDSMVLDFAKVKEGIGAWIDEELDHNVILQKGDPLLLMSLDDFGGKRPYTMDTPPTAEELALMIFVRTAAWLPRLSLANEVWCRQVTIHETAKCSASYLS